MSTATRQIVRLGRPRDERRRGFTLTPGAVGGQAAPAEAQALAPVAWAPLPGPQTLALESEADVLGYGGAGGGGKTDLLLGLAGSQHHKSVIFRREFPQLRDVIERSREIFARGIDSHAKDSYNEQLHLWRLGDGRLLELAACQREADKEKQRGRPRDFYGFDEANQFSESQVRFITGWNRTTRKGQRCRIVLCFNPPTDEAGRWVIRYFLPWMAYLFPTLPEVEAYSGTPAAPGELRYFAMVDGAEVEVAADYPKARSRTFIPARVEDNPYLMEQGYDATLEAMPEPLRSQMRYGDFAAGATEVDPWQVIPSPWIAAAVARWTEVPPEPGASSSIGVDPARGGRDQTVIAVRVGAWWDMPEVYPGSSTPDGPSVAALALARATQLEDREAGIFVDVIGVGASVYDSLIASGAASTAVNAGAGAEGTDRSGRMTFGNVRAASWWRLREALDPEHGDQVALPPDPELLAELRAPRFRLRSGRIWVEEKDEIRKRIGRSTDRADAVILAHEEAQWYAG